MTVLQMSPEIKMKVIRVLAIEDNPGDYRLVNDMLREIAVDQFQTLNANKLSSAIDVMNRQAFDAVLLDLNLPDSSGFDSFSVLHDRFPAMPIVILTGSTNEELAIRAINEGAQDYLFKDELTPRTLSHSILYAMERKGLEEETARYVRINEDILKSIKDGLFALDREWRFIFLNEKVSSIVGKSLKNWLGRISGNITRTSLGQSSKGHIE